MWLKSSNISIPNRVWNLNLSLAQFIYYNIGLFSNYVSFEICLGNVAERLLSEHRECCNDSICSLWAVHSGRLYACIEAVGKATIPKLAQAVMLIPHRVCSSEWIFGVCHPSSIWLTSEIQKCYLIILTEVCKGEFDYRRGVILWSQEVQLWLLLNLDS